MRGPRIQIGRPVGVAGMVRCGFTLVELLITIAIMGLLIGLVLPVLGQSLRAARSFRCQMSLRSVAFDFAIFGDRELHGDRGDDRMLPGDRFRLETFQESQYGLDEFWRWGDVRQHELPDANNNDPMRCAQVNGFIMLSRDRPCGDSRAISPAKNVSYGFNARLDRPEVRRANGSYHYPPISLTSTVLSEGNVPLAWDIDGQLAVEKGAVPVFSTPSLRNGGAYGNERMWFPSFRHNGAGNYAFIGGHVLSSSTPLAQSSWQWGYQPID